MSLDSIVNISISNTSIQVSRAGFGVPMVLGFHTNFPERIRFYSDIAGMVTDGFVSTDAEYKAVAACFAQNPRPPQVAVGRRLTVPTWDVYMEPLITTTGEKYEWTIGSESFSYTLIAADVTVADVVGKLLTAMSGRTGAWVASYSSDGISIRADVAGEQFDFVIDKTFLDTDDITTVPAAPNGIAKDLDEILLVSSAWYGLITTFHNDTEIEAAAAWIETNKRLFVASSLNSDVLAAATTDISGVLQAAGYTRTAVIHNTRVHTFPEAAWMGKLFPTDPGSASWANKALTGITPETYTTTQQNNMQAKNCNYYMVIGETSVTQTGQVASGEWLDIIRGLDWLSARMRERIWALLVSVAKIPYTQGGIDLVVAEVDAQLAEAVGKGLLAPIDRQAAPPEGGSGPDIADVSAADKGARLLPDITFVATLQGAIHTFTVTGTVSV